MVVTSRMIPRVFRVCALSIAVAASTVAAGTEGPGAARADTLLGIRPAVTVEPEYPAGAFDINLVPLCVELGIPGTTLALRADLLFTVQFGNGAPTLRNAGILAGMPWYPFARSGESAHSGFFVGPKTGLSYNVAGAFWSTGMACETGWSLDLDSWMIMACAEGGATLFLKEGSVPRWSGHGGLSCIAGYRF